MIYQVLLRKMEGIEWEMLYMACSHKPFLEKHRLYNAVQGRNFIFWEDSYMEETNMRSI